MTADNEAPDTDRTTRLRRPLLGALAATVLLLCAASYMVGNASGTPLAPGDDSAAAGFARDMQTHHAQAVETSLIVRDRTDDEPIGTLAYDIALTQQQQIGQMYG